MLPDVAWKHLFDIILLAASVRWSSSQNRNDPLSSHRSPVGFPVELLGCSDLGGGGGGGLLIQEYSLWNSIWLSSWYLALSSGEREFRFGWLQSPVPFSWIAQHGHFVSANPGESIYIYIQWYGHSNHQNKLTLTRVEITNRNRQAFQLCPWWDEKSLLSQKLILLVCHPIL